VNAYGWQKSSFSAEAGNCLEMGWRKSTYSGDSSNCLNLAAAPGRTTLLRESDDPAVVIATTHTRLAGLIAAIKADRLT
jgi:uncharacterized protein DUF397